MVPKDDSPYLDWRADPAQARLPARSLPDDRRNFGCPHRATAQNALHCGGGGLLQSVRELVPIADCLVKPAKEESPIPAGYTYLGQLLAHDLCGASEGVFDYPLNGVAQAVAQPSARRGLPLQLESLLGPVAARSAGPALWRFPTPAPGFPFVSVDLPRLRRQGRAQRSLGAVADARNDDNPMIAQLGALFILLAQRIEAGLLDAGADPATARLTARLRTVRSWHNILRRDYLPRLCLPGMTGTRPDRRGAAAIPVELTHAVMRFGHWMVRSQYRMNRDTVATADLLAGIDDIEERRSRPGSENFWRIDWRNFFDLDPANPPQHALALGGGVAAMFGSDYALPDRLEIHSALASSDNDLCLRDLARSVDGGLQRVSVLAKRLAPRWQGRFPDWRLWTARGRRGVIQRFYAQAGLAPQRHLIEDPPLYLYVLAEAGAGPQAEGYGNGASLGALGSGILMASIHAALAASEAALPAAPIRAGYELPVSMPDLIRKLSA